MDLAQFNKKFDVAFCNALHRSFAQIKSPETHIILESWKSLQEKLALYRIDEPEIEK
jgi:hypothetical protein